MAENFELKDGVLKKSDTLIYSLSKKMLVFLFIYYFIILISGGTFAIIIACTLMGEVGKQQIMKLAFVISIAVSGMLCSVHYIRRLYKACLTNRIEISGDEIKCIGNVTYFLFRPLFALAFSIVMVFMLLSGMFIVTGNLDYILNEKFVYLCVVISSFLGYSVGNLIDRFEKISKEKISNLL